VTLATGIIAVAILAPRPRCRVAQRDSNPATTEQGSSCAETQRTRDRGQGDRLLGRPTKDPCAARRLEKGPGFLDIPPAKHARHPHQRNRIPSRIRPR
jgi:hypothetical protein